jgi:hypothetical protein
MRKILLLIFVLISVSVSAQLDITKRQVSLDTLKGRAYSKIYIRDTILFKDGSKQWTKGTTYVAGTGLTLTGTSFLHTAHTGDATGTTSLTVVALRGRSLSTIIPSNGNVLKWDAGNSVWYPVAP